MPFCGREGNQVGKEAGTPLDHHFFYLCFIFFYRPVEGPLVVVRWMGTKLDRVRQNKESE